MMKETFYVDGMHCKGCAMSVKTALELDMEGVASADVDLAGEKIVVEFDPNVATFEAMVSVVRDAGFALRKKEA